MLRKQLVKEQLKHVDNLREPLIVEKENDEAADENISNASILTPAVGVSILAAAGFYHCQFADVIAVELRDSLNTLRGQADEFHETVDILSSTVTKLEDEVDDLKISEKQLHELAKEQESNAQSIVDLKNLREKFVAEMIQIIMRSDRDNDMRVDLDEAEMLALRLGIQLQTHGIVLDRDMFMSMLEEDNSVESIIIFCAEVLYPEITLKREEEMNAAAWAEEEANNTSATDSGPKLSKHRTRSPSETFNRFIQAITSMNEDEQNREFRFSSLGLEDKMSMFTINQDYTRGSVSAARGRKITLLPNKLVATERRDRVTKVVSMASNQCRKASLDKESELVGLVFVDIAMSYCDVTRRIDDVTMTYCDTGVTWALNATQRI
eukprot:scaffold201305_cov70-Cyclotella_meneghiniana.AAC.9